MVVVEKKIMHEREATRHYIYRERYGNGKTKYGSTILQ